jgi:hypothetical protein
MMETINLINQSKQMVNKMTTKNNQTNVNVQDNNETIKTFVATKVPAPVLVSNTEINTSGIDDIRLDALREKGIKSFTGGGSVVVHYTDGKTVNVNGALAVAALLAGVTVTNLAESLGAGKFASRGKQIILPDNQVKNINESRMERHERDIQALADNLTNYITTAGIPFNDADLELYYTLHYHSLVCGADSTGIWVSYPSDKLPEEFGLLSQEVVKGRVSYEHRVTLAE